MFYFEGGEVPATKLAALQKVLQSEFLNAVREVYEHVYETVDVQGNPEIRASATAKVNIDLSTNPYLLLSEFFHLNLILIIKLYMIFKLL